MTPNTEYAGLEEAFDYFNERLFENKLPSVLITLRNNPRSRGYFRRNAFTNRIDDSVKTHEIALCPDTFASRTDREILSTLVHEQVHLWQVQYGKPGRRGYHNLEWAAKMVDVGLMPSDTGEPGGKLIGQRVTHYILAGGKFEVAVEQLLASGWRLQWQEFSLPLLTAALPKRP